MTDKIIDHRLDNPGSTEKVDKDYGVMPTEKIVEADRRVSHSSDAAVMEVLRLMSDVEETRPPMEPQILSGIGEVTPEYQAAYTAYRRELSEWWSSDTRKEHNKAKHRLQKYPNIAILLESVDKLAAASRAHASTIEAVERTTFTAHDPVSFALSRSIGEELNKAGGVAFMKLCLMLTPFADGHDSIWVATSWSGINSEWQVSSAL